MSQSIDELVWTAVFGAPWTAGGAAAAFG